MEKPLTSFARRMRRSNFKRCAFCRMLIVDPGSVLLSKVVSLDNLSNWCEDMLNMDNENVLARLKNSWKVCIYCIWDARFYHENTGGNANTVWWSTDDPFYKYFEAGIITKPSKVVIQKLTKFQIHQWTEAGKKNIACPVCGLKHGTDNAMYLHMLWKHPEKIFVKCKLCKEYVDKAIGMRAHFKEIHEGNVRTSLKCQFCKEIFTGQGRKYLRSQHIKRHHSEIAVRCAHFLCCRYFKSQAEMANHAEEKHDNILTRDKLCCIFCGVSYLGLQMLNKHVRKYHKREVRYCPQFRCGKYYKTEEEMQAHMKEDHHEKTPANDEMTECIICGRTISTLSHRIHTHMRMKHPKEAFKCKKPVCTAYFKTKAAATEHFQATHYLTDKFAKNLIISCDHCNFQTKWRTNLECHIVIRHFPRTHKCPECPKKFASKKHIIEHARKTHNKNRKKCPHCGMAPTIYNSHVVNTKCFKCFEPFKCFALLKKHQKKCKLAFKCDICEKQFEVESILLKHFKSAHRRNNKNIWLGAKKHKGSDFKCEPCKIYFKHEGFLNNHVKNFHDCRNTCTCNICGKVVRCKSRMENHLVLVHGILK